MTAQRRLKLLIGALAITAAFIAYDRSAPTLRASVAVPVAPRVTTTFTAPEEHDTTTPSVIQALMPRADYEREGGNAFASPPPPKAEAPRPVTPPAPVAPPVPFTVIGKKGQSGVWEVYLALQDDIFIAHNGDVINGSYKVVSIIPPTMQLTYLPMNETQTVDIGGGSQ